MYWKSTDCSERYLSQLPGGRVANFILEQRRSSHPTSPSVKRSTKTKFVEKIPEKDVDILDLDPYRQVAYLEPSNPVNVLKVRKQWGSKQAYADSFLERTLIFWVRITNLDAN